MTYKDGLFVHIWCDWGVPNNIHDNRTIRINFEKGYIIRKPGNGILEAVSYADGAVTDLSDRYREVKSSYRDEIEYFADCVAKGIAPAYCPPEETKNVIRVMRAQERSADNNGAHVNI